MIKRSYLKVFAITMIYTLLVIVPNHAYGKMHSSHDSSDHHTAADCVVCHQAFIYVDGGILYLNFSEVLKVEYKEISLKTVKEPLQIPERKVRLRGPPRIVK